MKHENLAFLVLAVFIIALFAFILTNTESAIDKECIEFCKENEFHILYHDNPEYYTCVCLDDKNEIIDYYTHTG